MDYKHHEYIVIGAGPAGLQAAYELEHNSQDYVVLERSSAPGAFFTEYPRHKKLISINKVHTGYDDTEVNLRWDWNSLLTHGDDSHLFKEYSEQYFPTTDTLVSYLRDYASKYSLNIQNDAEVESVRKDEGNNTFYVRLTSGAQFSAKHLIIATGLFSSWEPDVPGFEHAVSYCNMEIDPNKYKNKRVLIVGKGNSAFETADALISHAAMIHMSSPNSLKFAWSSHYVGHVRAVNNDFLDTYHLKSQNAVLDADIKSIRKIMSGGYEVTFAYKHAEDEIEEIFYDSIISCTGFRFNVDMFDDSCKPALCDRKKFPLQNSNWESENVSGLYFAGTLMQQRDYRKYMSGFIHGFRYNVRVLINLLLEKYANKTYPSHSLALCENELTEWVINRINRSSALWQQPGFLADVIHVDTESKTLSIREELPKDYIQDEWLNTNAEYYTLTLEYGAKKFDNPFNVSRISRDNVNRSEDSNFLHPILRHYKNGELVNSHHVIENLFAEWQRPEHIEPMVNYFKAEFSTAPINEEVALSVV